MREDNSVGGGVLDAAFGGLASLGCPQSCDTDPSGRDVLVAYNKDGYPPCRTRRGRRVHGACRPSIANGGTNLCDEARGFAQSMAMYGNGCDEGMSFYRGAFLKAAEVINSLCDELDKEKKSGKETFPPAPPIKKRGKEEKSPPHPSAHARTREVVFVGPVWEEVLRYVSHPKVKIDADYALWWYGQMDALGWCNPDCIEEPIRNWKQLLRAWWVQRGKRDGNDWKRPVEKLPRKYSAEEWQLCAERCRHYDEKVCRCRSGCTIPPDLRQHPLAPEECERFARKEVAR